LVKEKAMKIDLSLPPGLQSILRDDVLFWIRDAASGGRPFSDLKREGLSFLDDWENLSEEEQEAVGEIMSAVFRAEDLSEPLENAQQIAQKMVERLPSLFDDLGKFISTAGTELVSRPLLYSLVLFALSPDVLEFPEEFEPLLRSYSQNGDGEFFPFNGALAKAGTHILDEFKSGKIDVITAKWKMATLLACLHPSFFKGVFV
jgi:hypothetical protein